jgi:hypothetical protein
MAASASRCGRCCVQARGIIMLIMSNIVHTGLSLKRACIHQVCRDQRDEGRGLGALVANRCREPGVGADRGEQAVRYGR